MVRLIVLLVGLVCGSSSLATDVTVLAGYQFNSDVEISTSVGRRPVSSSAQTPETGSEGDSVAIDDGGVYSLGVDFVFNQNQNQRIGFYLSSRQTSFENNAGLVDRDLRVTHLHFTAMSYYPRGKLEPFVMAGVGAGFFAPGDSTLREVARFSAQIGAGTNYRLNRNLLLRLDLRWLPTFFNDDSTVFCKDGCTISLRSDSYTQVQANAGLMFRF